MRARARWIATIVAAVVALPVLVIVIITADDTRTGCATADYGQGVSSADGGRTLAGYGPAQLEIARIAVAVGEQRGASPNVIVAALMAGMQESSLRNLSNPAVPGSDEFAHDGTGADHDSVGPWQMRMEVWGSVGVEQLMNPVYQANWFFGQAENIPGADSMDVGELAQAVEGSQFPDAYGTHQAEARELYTALRGSGARSPHLASGPAPRAGKPATDSGCGTKDSGGEDGGTFGDAVVAAAMQWIGMPYVWGGGDVHGPTTGIWDAPEPGFDCSGLTLFAVHAASGGEITLAHTTSAQVADPHGRAKPLGEKKRGDLIFFGADVHHVAIYVGEVEGQPMVVHAPDFGDHVKLGPLWTTEPMEIRRFGPDDVPSSSVAALGPGTSAGTRVP